VEFITFLEFFDGQKFLEPNSADEKSRTESISSTDPNLLKPTGRILTLFVLLLF